MIYCPKCGSATKTYSSCETDRGYHRRMECLHCWIRFKTIEVFDGYSERQEYQRCCKNCAYAFDNTCCNSDSDQCTKFVCDDEVCEGFTAKMNKKGLKRDAKEMDV